MIEWRIALRNLREHKTKTIIVGVLIAVAMTILVAGNSIMDSITARMEANYRDTYTGDAVVHAESAYQVSLFGVQGLDRLNAVLPPVPATREVVATVEETGGRWAGLVQTQGQFLHRQSAAGFGMLWGVEPQAYLDLFADGLEITEGAFFGSDARGIVLNERAVRQIESETGVRYAPGDTIAIQSNSPAGGSRIREVPVRGVFSFDQQNPQLANVSLIDVATARELAGLDVEQITESDLSEEQRGLLGDVSEDDLFGAGGLFVEPAGADEGGVDDSDRAGAIDLENVLGDRTTNTTRDSAFDLDVWHFIIAKADGPRAAERLYRELHRKLTGTVGVAVGDWQWAAGATVTLVVGVQLVFNAVVLIISIVSIIIIVNTLVISITERIPEIGTIRAIGGKKRFVRRLITRETLVITGTFGLAGMLAGSLIVGLLALAGIDANSEFLQLLLGGTVFRPGISPVALVSSLASVALMAWVASLYPVAMATRISPVRAMQRG